MLQAVRQISVAIVACLDLIHSFKIVSISVARDRNCQTELSSGARASLANGNLHCIRSLFISVLESYLSCVGPHIR